MSQRVRRRLFASALIIGIVLAVYAGWGPVTGLFWAPPGSHVVLIVDGERYESWLGDNCYGVGCLEFDGYPVGERPISVGLEVPFAIDFPELTPVEWRAVVSRIPAYSGLDRSDGLPNLLRLTGTVHLVSNWDDASQQLMTPTTAPGWYIVDVSVEWPRGGASYIFWLNVSGTPQS